MIAPIINDSMRRLFKSWLNWTMIAIVLITTIYILINASLNKTDLLKNNEVISPLSTLFFPVCFLGITSVIIGIRSGSTKELTLILARPINRTVYSTLNLIVPVVMLFFFGLLLSLLILGVGYGATDGLVDNLFFGYKPVEEWNSTWFSVSYGHFLFYISSVTIFSFVLGSFLTTYTKDWFAILIGSAFNITIFMFYMMSPLLNSKTMESTVILELVANVYMPIGLLVFSLVIVPGLNAFIFERKKIKI